MDGRKALMRPDNGRRMSGSRKSGLGLVLLLAAPLASGPSAHHSLVAEFDVNETIELRGEVTRLDWSNPHITLFLEVRGEDGARQDWECELGSPNPLIQVGWRKEDLPVGATIRVKANLARDGSPRCSSRELRLDDGSPVFTRYGGPSSSSRR